MIFSPSYEKWAHNTFGPYINGVKVDWDFWISDLVKNHDGTDI